MVATERDARVYSSDPRFAAIEYARSPGIPTVVRALCVFAAMECGLGDGTELSLSDGWATDLEDVLADEFPTIDVKQTLRDHLSGVCRVVFDSERIHISEPHSRGRLRKAISAQASLAVFARDSFRCLHCGESNNLTVDHITPLVRGGTNDPDNLQTLCRSCNSRKGTS